MENLNNCKLLSGDSFLISPCQESLAVVYEQQQAMISRSVSCAYYKANNTSQMSL